VADAEIFERLASDSDRAVEIAVLEFRHDAIQAFRERRLAGARRAHHADRLARGLREGYRSKRGPVGAVVGEGHTFDRRCVRGSSSNRNLSVGFHIMNRPANANSRNGPTIIKTGLSYGATLIHAGRNFGTQ